MKKCFLRFSRLIFIIVAFVLTSFSFLNAQITGTITDAVTGEPLIGATVQIKGSTTGTIADFDGNYAVNASQGDVLNFSYVGYITQEVTVGAQTTINMQLKEDIQELEKVVIVGYSTKKKSDLTGAVSSVSSKELAERPSADVASALSGRAAGVMITKSSGSPGANSVIRVRGVGSINNSDPLYVVDGVPIEGEPNLRPEDIESIEVLKDASATAIYGNRGANGVIIISSKRGTSGKKPKVNFSYYTGSSFAHKLEMLNADQYVELMDTMYSAYNRHSSTKEQIALPQQYSDSIRDFYGNADTDWQDEITQVGKVNNYFLSVSGGGENTNYSISGNYYKEDGVLLTTYAERFGFKANSDFKVSDRIKIGESVSISRGKSKGGSGWNTALKASPLMPVYDTSNLGGYAGPLENSGLIWYPGADTSELVNYTGSNDKTNPVAELKLNESTTTTTNILGNVYTNIEIFKGFSYEFRIGIDYRYQDVDSYSPKYDLGVRSNDPSNLSRSANERYRWNLNNILRYHKDIGKHDINLLLGQEATSYQSVTFGASGESFPTSVESPVLTLADQSSYVATESIGINKLRSYFGRVDYVYGNKYLLTFNYRNDASSRFKESNREGNFWSGSLGWRFTEENFMQNISFLNNGKVRFGYGKVGNQDVVGDYDWQNVLDPYKNSRAVFGSGNVQEPSSGAMVLASFKNPEIGWEESESYTFGTDLAFLSNKILLNVDYYIRNTKNMLVRPQTTLMSGRLNARRPYINLDGLAMQNKGWEFTISYRKYEGVFNYSVSGNATINDNKIVSDIGQVFGSGSYTSSEEGMPVASYYGYVTDGLFTSQAELDAWAEQYGENTDIGDIKYKDLNGDGVISDADRTYIGNSVPKLTAGLSLNAEYKGFDLNIFIQGMYGFYIYNQLGQYIKVPQSVAQGLDENKTVDALNYYSPTNTNTDVPRAFKDESNQHSNISDYPLWFEKGDFTRLKNVQLGYTLPNSLVSKINISRLRVYVSGQNLYTLTQYTGYDPEFSSANPLDGRIDNGTYPLSKTVLFGVQIDF